MSRFKIGDRVEISGDIARYYTCRIGVVTGIQQLPACDEFALRLADGRRASFVDFQLRKPPGMAAQVLFDSDEAARPQGVRGTSSDRHLRFSALNRDIHLKIADSESGKQILGRVISPGFSGQCSLITLRRETGTEETISTNHYGEFRFDQIHSGILQLEVFEPSLRIVASFLA